MPAPVVPLRALDFEPARVAVRAALLANATISGTGAPVVGVADMTDTAAAYIAITLLLYKPTNTYDATQGELTIQLTYVSMGSPDVARTLRAAAQTALLDSAWTITGYDLLDVRLDRGMPDGAPLVQSKIVFSERDRFCIRIRKQQ